MENFRVGVVGCGGIAQVHGTVLQHLEGVELVGCADIKPERAQAFAETYGGRAYSSMEELLEHEQLDAVHLCTPHYLHTPMAKLAASRGLHVFTEKPPVMTWEQWAEFRQLEQAPIRVGVCFQNRYNPSVQLLREVLASGKAGKVLGARAFVTWHREAPYYTESGWRGSLQTEGGGVLINQSIHTLDLLGQFLGRATQVEASMMNHHLKGVIEVEDMMEAYLTFGEAHAIFYALTAYPVIEERHLHGEVVAFGILIALLVDGQKEEFEKIYELNKSIGLPTRLSDIEITPAQWEECLDRIPTMSDVAHYPYKVTRPMLEDAMKTLEERAVSHR